jgi:predicted membrane protein
MKKIILFGTLFSICMIMLMNTASSIEYKTVNDYNRDLLESQLDNINNFIEKIQQTLGTFEIYSDEVIFKNEIKEFSNQLSELKISILDNPNLPTCIRTIFGILIGLIFSIIGTILGIIFGPLLAFVVRILTAPAVLLAKLIAFIVNLFTP